MTAPFFSLFFPLFSGEAFLSVIYFPVQENLLSR